jgi:E3 ubiquitin-protein ligase DOA10
MVSKMSVLNAAIPGAFSDAKNNYLYEIDKLKLPIENEYQNTLNIGFKQIYFTVTIVALLALCILAIYKKKTIQDTI